MNIRTTLLAGVLAGIVSCGGLAHAQYSQIPWQQSASPAGKAESMAAIHQQSQLFIENKGQWDSRAKFLLRSSGMDMWVTDHGVVYDLHKTVDANGNVAARSGASLMSDRMTDPKALAVQEASLRRVGHVVAMHFEGTTTQSTPLGLEKQPGYYNYFIGNDSTKWASNVGLYASARVDNVYAGINAVFYLDNGKPRYDLVLAPGADPSQVRMSFEGAEGVKVNADGSLAIATTMGDIQQQGLFAYQIDGMRKVQVPCGFITHQDGSVGFAVGNYDRSRVLVVDPLVYSTYLGGGDADYCNAGSLDTNGNYFTCGETYGANFPVTIGAYEWAFRGKCDLFVSKLNSMGTELLYSTYVGGEDVDVAFGLAVDVSGNAFLTGYTLSRDFPLTNGVYKNSGGAGPSSDLIICKFNPRGSTLLLSTHFGGGGFEEGRDIALDASGNIYVIGNTSDPDFPVTSNAYQKNCGGGDDAFVCKLNSNCTALLYSTFIGGSGYDDTYGLAIDTAGNAYLSGTTSSLNFPVTNGAYQTIVGGQPDAFVCKLNAAGSALSYSTYIGGSAEEEGAAIAVDANGNAYVTGETQSGNFPVTSNAYQLANGGKSDAYVFKLNSSGSALSFSTYIGGSANEVGTRIAIGGNGSVYVAGKTFSLNFPATFGAFQSTMSGVSDVFICKFDSNSSRLSYCTYLGGTGDEEASSLALDKSGDMYICGLTSSHDFPRTLGAYQAIFGGGADVFLTRFSFPIFVTSPIGGESWQQGSTHQITWTSTAIDSVSITLSSDGGATWSSTISTSTPAGSGSYMWHIPTTQPVGTIYLIKLTDLHRTNIYSISPALFSITAAAGLEDWWNPLGPLNLE